MVRLSSSAAQGTRRQKVAVMCVASLLHGCILSVERANPLCRLAVNQLQVTDQASMEFESRCAFVPSCQCVLVMSDARAAGTIT